MWIAIWGNDHNKTPEQQLIPFEKERSKDAFDVLTKKRDGLAISAYRLDENRREENRIVHSLNAHVAGKTGFVQISFYFDDVADSKLAIQILETISETK